MAKIIFTLICLLAAAKAKSLRLLKDTITIKGAEGNNIGPFQLYPFLGSVNVGKNIS
jgi:hypothetical protein